MGYHEPMSLQRPSRRTFLRLAAAAPLAAAREVLPGLRVLDGAVNTALFTRRGKNLLIDSGETQSAAEWALYTHHHPDQASGAPGLAAAGTKILAPAAERRFFEDANAVWDAADARLDHDYNCRPELLTLRESVPVTRAVKSGDIHEWEGLRFEAIETPGHTDGSVTYLVELGGKRLAFTGDLIYAPGKIRDIYSLQKAFPGMRGGYWGFGGAVADVKASLDRVLARKPDLLIPSHGEIIRDPAGAVAALKQNLDAVMENYLTTCAWRANMPDVYNQSTPRMLDPLPAPPYPKWCRDITYTTKAIVADDGSVFLSDCGAARVVDELARLQAAGKIGKIDGLWITHYHDDHTQAVNLAKDRFGVEVYAQQALVDVLEHPKAYQLPCLFPEPIRVEHPLRDRETFQWKGFTFTAFDFPCQTLYHDGLLVERDGFQVFFTGDGFSSRSFSDVCSQNRNFSGRGRGFEKCCRLLLEIKPDILMAAHWGPLAMPPAYLEKFIAGLEAREKLYARLFPYGDVNFGTDPYWLRAYPFRQQAAAGSQVEVEARVLNHGSRPMQARLELALPPGWKPVHTSAEDKIGSRSEGRLRFMAQAPPGSPRRRHVLGLQATVDGWPMGESAAAIVDLA
jgi:glyoxylase-like metal-dependent hydrolase (beta-lactamase superfamily II)